MTKVFSEHFWSLSIVWHFWAFRWLLCSLQKSEHSCNVSTKECHGPMASVMLNKESIFSKWWQNKANLRDLIAATLKNNRAHLLLYFNLRASFRSHWWIQTWVTPFIPCRSALPFLRYGYLKQGKSEGFESCDWPIVRKRPIWVKIGDALSRVTMKFDRWP